MIFSRELNSAKKLVVDKKTVFKQLYQIKTSI
jgi:hypothetical protein